MTPTQTALISAKLLYVVTYPEDKRSYVSNERFGIAIGFQNTGTVTWEPGANNINNLWTILNTRNLFTGKNNRR